MTTTSIEHFELIAPGVPAVDDLLEVRSPYDGSLIGTVAQTNWGGADRALSTAFQLFRDRDGWLPAPQRIEILEKAGEIMQSRRRELALGAAREGGKPLRDSLVETDRAIDGMQVCIEHLRTQSGREIPMGINAASMNRLAFTRHEPRGVVLSFSAFNHPLNLIAHQVAPAVAVGCPVIIKPAEATPLSCFRFVEILLEAGLPEGWCQAISIDNHETAGQVVSDPRVSFFSFIGSGKVGWMLRSTLAPGTRCALEHGGTAPVIVTADADLDDALPLLTKGGFYHAGQVCVSVQRVYAHRSIAEDLARRLGKAAKALTVGDPTEQETEVGPLIREDEVTRVHEWVQEAVDGGATLVTGGQPIGTRCYEPTVLLDPPADADVTTKEIFGPVVCVYTCDDFDDALARSNSQPYAFQASVFTRNLDAALRASSRFDAATVMVNDHTAFRVDWMPFAGLKQSGLGIGGMPYTMEDMQVEKQTVIRSREV